MMAVAFPGSWPRRRWLNLLGIVLTLLLLALGVGFAWFLHVVTGPAEAPPHADGIVAFTGGPERVETALRLLAEGHGDRLLLSGIGGGAELGELAHRAGLDPLPLATRVTIGRNATTTRGNAAETAGWARANAVHSLLVVTASYHMPRALTELGRALPDVTLYPVPVSAGRPGLAGIPLRLIGEEYAKFLATRIGLSSMLPSREAPVVHGGHPG